MGRIVSPRSAALEVAPEGLGRVPDLELLEHGGGDDFPLRFFRPELPDVVHDLLLPAVRRPAGLAGRTTLTGSITLRFRGGLDTGLTIGGHQRIQQGVDLSPRFIPRRRQWCNDPFEWDDAEMVGELPCRAGQRQPSVLPVVGWDRVRPTGEGAAYQPTPPRAVLGRSPQGKKSCGPIRGEPLAHRRGCAVRDRNPT